MKTGRVAQYGTSFLQGQGRCKGVREMDGYNMRVQHEIYANIHGGTIILPMTLHLLLLSTTVYYCSILLYVRTY